MCGRVAAKILAKALKARFGANPINLDEVFPRYHVRPTNLIPAIRLEAGERIASPNTWGYLPPHAEDTSFISRYFTFNATAEKLMESRLYAKPFKQARCLVVVSGWYEWPKEPGAKKPSGPPHFFSRPDDDFVVFAGLWGPWKDPATGLVRETATVITVPPNELVQALPHHRMPAILPEEAWEPWLDTRVPVEEAHPLLRSSPSEWLREWEVRPLKGDDNPGMCEPVGAR